MEREYQTLKRPKRKLCYLTNKESPSKEWAGKLSLGDIDGMFDDLDSSLHDDDIIPTSPLPQTNQNKREISPVPQEGDLTIKLPGPGGDVLHPTKRSLSPTLDIDLNIPFKVHGPVKTSSPIEENMVVETIEEQDNERALVVPQTLIFEEAKADPVNTENPQCNGHVTEEEELESPPSKVAFSKPTMSKNKVAGSCKQSHPVKEKIPKKPQTPVLEAERKTPRQESTELHVSAVRQVPELPTPEKNSGDHRQPSAETSTHGGKDIKAFLQKVRDAERTKPACSKGLQSLVKVPTLPPEPEDEFLILEDDAPLFYIPCKTSNRNRQRQKETVAEQSSTDKDSSTDKGMKDRPLETPQKDEELEKANPKQASQPNIQKMKKNKGKEKKNEVTGPANDEMSIPEDLPAGDLVEQDKPNKKKQLKKVPPKESNMAEDEPKERDSRETDEETCFQKMEKKTQKSSEVKSSKSSQDGKENAKTTKAKSLKKITNVIRGSEGIKQTACVEAVKEQNEKMSSEKHTEPDDLGSFSDEEIVDLRGQSAKVLVDGKAKQNKLPTVSEGSSSEDGQVLGKRKRKHPGEWWLSCPQSTEETNVTDNQLTLKKLKQNKREPRTAIRSPVKANKDRILKRRNHKQPASSSSGNTNTAEENKIKKNKNRTTRGVTPGKIKTTHEVFKTTEVEQIEEQEQDVPDQDLDLGHSSPLVFTQRNLNLSSGNQVFQRVYHHVSNEKVSSTPKSVSPRRPKQQLREGESGKRRKKPPGNWWLVNDMSECSSSQPQQPHLKEPKPCKERKKQSKQNKSPRLGTPKDGNMAVSSKPQGRASTPSRKLKPLSAPKTVKRSLAMFKDIFTSATETETVNSRDACQNNKHNVNAHSAEEVGVFPQNHETPLDNCQSENTLKELRSGPSSMIQLEQYEENEDLILPSSRVHAALSISDLCAPPLKPLILQPKDKANLAEWFKSLWPTAAPNAAEITPNHFDWYFYQDRAIGFLLDVNYGSACIGRILLGSYMKKPLWVDHSASTVFHLLTSSVNVVIDSRESRFDAGQCFTVQCGHAYSIQNITAQPAVLYFTRLAEGSD